MELRPYQSVIVEDLRAAFARGRHSPLLVAPTGSGKTVVFSYIAARVAQRSRRIQILVHRDELLDQVSNTLNEFDVRYASIRAGMTYDPGPLVHVSSVFTVARRLDRIPVPNLVIVDEAHHCIGRTTWGEILATWRLKNPALHVIGVTATPERLSGEGLGQSFDEMILGPTTAELIDIGALARYRLFAPSTADVSGVHIQRGDFKRDEAEAAVSKPNIVGDAVSHYRRHCNGAPAIVFCVSVQHAEMMAARFRSEGYHSVSLDGRMDRGIRRGIVADFRRGALNVLTSCDLISEGFDLPGIHAAILLRPTWSLAMHLQQIGRALRPAEGKDAAIILDHVGNTQRLGLPDAPRAWTLEGREARRKREEDGEAGPTIRQCPACFAISPAAASRCRECGAEFPITPRVVDEIDGELSEVEIARLRRDASRAQSSAQSLQALTDLGRLRGYKSPERWAEHVWRARQIKRGTG